MKKINKDSFNNLLLKARKNKEIHSPTLFNCELFNYSFFFVLLNFCFKNNFY